MCRPTKPAGNKPREHVEPGCFGMVRWLQAQRARVLARMEDIGVGLEGTGRRREGVADQPDFLYNIW